MQSVLDSHSGGRIGYGFLPIPLIREKHIVNKLLKRNAVSVENAITFHEGIINLNRFQMVTRCLVGQSVIYQSGDKYYFRHNKAISFSLTNRDCDNRMTTKKLIIHILWII